MDKSLFRIGLPLLIGFMWGFVIFSPWPNEEASLKKQGAISVYEGQTKCEKALDTWVCVTQNGGRDGH